MKYSVFLIMASCFLCLSASSSDAFLTPHPIQLYEKGDALVSSYSGNADGLMAAQDVFIVLIEKYPNSPFGYLGMSHLYRVDAYLGEENYDLKLIRERALPFALKALQLGPSIKAVHENYAFFEQFFRDKKDLLGK